MHTTFTRIDRRVRRAVRELFDAKPYRGTAGEQAVKFERFVSLCAPIYGIATPRVAVQPWYTETGLGKFNAATNTS